MPITQAEMIATVRERLDELAAGEWTDTELRRWTNKGCRDLVRSTEVLDSLVLIALPASTPTITTPIDMIRCSHVDWIDSNGRNYPLEFRTFNAMDPVWYADRVVTQSRPQFYTVTGFVPTASFRIYPVPAEVGSLSVKYYRLSAELAIDGTQSNSVLEIPEGWDDAVACYVEYMALRKDRDPRWQEAKSLYDEARQTLHDLSRYLSEEPGQVVPQVSHGGLPGWLVNDGGWGSW